MIKLIDHALETCVGPCFGGETNAQGCVPNLLVGAVAATGTTAAKVGTPGQNLGGLPTSDAPLWTATLGPRYQMAVGGGKMLDLETDARYSSSYLGSPFGSPLSRQSAYINLDASIRLHTTDDRWELAVIGKNLTNKFVITGETDAAGTGTGTGTAAGRSADQVGFGAMPRTVQVQVTFRMP